MSVNEKTTDFCGCHFIETQKKRMTITTESGSEIACAVIGIFHTPGCSARAHISSGKGSEEKEAGRQTEGQDYIVLIPEDGSTDGKGFLFRFSDPDGNSPVLSGISTDGEYRYASSVFDYLRNNIDINEDDG